MTAAHRYNLALVFLMAGMLWSLVTFAVRWSNPEGYHVTGFANSDWYRYYLLILSQVRIFLPYLSLIYLFWLTMRIARFCRLYLATNKLRRDGLHKVPVEWRLYLEHMSGHMHIGRKVTIWFSEKIDTPILLGWLKPMILLPFSAATQLSNDQLEAILLHELAHIRRNDFFWNIIVSLAEVVLFYNPFAKLLISAIREEREHSCDDWVLQFPYKPESYANALLRLEQQRVYPASQLLLAARGNGSRLLLQRVKRMLHLPGEKREPIGKLAILTVMIGMLVMLALVEPREEIKTFVWDVVQAPVASLENRISRINFNFANADNGEPAQPETKKKSVKLKPKSTEAINRNNSAGHDLELSETQIDNLQLVADFDATPSTDPYEAAAPAYDFQLAPNTTPALVLNERAFVLPDYRESLPDDVPVGSYMPYVPLNSFQVAQAVSEDTARMIRKNAISRNRAAMATKAQGTATQKAELSLQAKQMALQVQLALDQLNWEKLKLKLERSGASAESIQYELEKELAKLDWNKLQLQAKCALEGLSRKADQEQEAEKQRRNVDYIRASEQAQLDGLSVIADDGENDNDEDNPQQKCQKTTTPAASTTVTVTATSKCNGKTKTEVRKKQIVYF
ncbi:M56 family metallopeptidase [Flavihumibacter petaseus]|nr:M56 family metallopeptidase [Flavihumibacter petaseus]